MIEALLALVRECALNLIVVITHIVVTVNLRDVCTEGSLVLLMQIFEVPLGLKELKHLIFNGGMRKVLFHTHIFEL